MSQYLNMPVLAVGAAFDYPSGLLQEPPQFLQQVSLQWLYRLCQDPGRLCGGISLRTLNSSPCSWPSGFVCGARR
jgi:exopolysaccharide biosynthesis WecB/TagA/CpsF family protein